MKFNKFKKTYKELARSETPKLDIVPAVTEAKRVPLSERTGFRFGIAALSLLLAVGIGMTVTRSLPNGGGSVTLTEETALRPTISACGSYDELDGVFKSVSKQRSWLVYSGALKSATYGNDIPEGGIDTAGMIADGLFSETNTQVDGVDEADIIKTDGTCIYYAKGDSIEVFKVDNPGNITKQSEIMIGTYIANSDVNRVNTLGMYLESSRLTVIFNAEPRITLNSGEAEDNEYKSRFVKTGVAVFDVSSPSSHRLIKLSMTEGSLISSRRIGDRIYLAVNRGISCEDYSGDPSEYVPHYYDTCKGSEYLPVPAKSIYLPENPEGDFLTLCSIDLSDGTKPMNSLTVIGSGCNVYSTESHFYVFASTYNDSGDGTNIYKFSIDKDDLALLTTAAVKGTMINQFAADEYEGNLRVATTENAYGYGSAADGTDRSRTNGITILDEELNKLGELTGLAKGERIYSVRFNGATGYVVTFRTVDPLFAFDLSDPKAPVITGELKMPGYSEYLHPYGDSFLIGLGQDAATRNENDDIAYYTGLKISLFGVGNELSEIDTYKLGDRGTNSDAEFNHKAFTYYPSRDVFGFPVSLASFGAENMYGGDITEYAPLDSYGFYVFSANGGEKISLVSTVKQMNKYENETLMIRRGIFIGDNVFTVSDEKIQANNIMSGDFIGSLFY